MATFKYFIEEHDQRIGDTYIREKQEDIMADKIGNPLSPNYYAKWKIQPLEFITQNNLDFLRGCVLKYIMRYEDKNGLEDLQKARVYLDKLIEKVGDGVDCGASGDARKHVSLLYTASIAHISEEDNEFLCRAAFNPDSVSGNPFIFRIEAGFFIFLGDKSDASLDIEGSMSAGFREICCDARRVGALWLILDRDADIDRRFAAYDW